jgi:hypothetical protein
MTCFASLRFIIPALTLNGCAVANSTAAPDAAENKPTTASSRNLNVTLPNNADAGASSVSPEELDHLLDRLEDELDHQGSTP